MMGRPSKVNWTPEQLERIRREYPEIGPKKLAELMEVDEVSLTNKAYYLGVKKKKDFHWTGADEEIVRSRYETDGPSVLAAELGITPVTVVAKARRMGVGSTRKTPPKGFVWTEEMITAVRNRYETEGANRLASDYGVTVTTIRRKAAEYGLHTIAGHAEAGKIRAEKTSSCNIHYFDEWSPNMAYILGFLFADGSINARRTALVVRLASRDECVLKFIQKEIQSTHRIYPIKERIHKSTGYNAGPQSVLAVGSTVLVRKLMILGMLPRKTYNNDPFPKVPDDMMPHFIRGFLDGDGSICIGNMGCCSVNFVGPIPFIEGIRDSLIRLAGMSWKKHHPRGQATVYTYIAWAALRDLRLFREFAYPDGYGFCLERKKTILDMWLSRERYEKGHYYPRKNGATSGEDSPEGELT